MKSDVEKRLSEFRKLRKIGEGTYGEVYEAMDTINNRRVAMKKLRIENKDEGIPITALREMCILKHLHHENVVELYEIIQDVDKIVLIFEYADMDLKMYIDKEKGIRDVKIIQVNIYISNIIVFYSSNVKWFILLQYQSYNSS